jgi:formylglycine-generating enzyme required for sulfatase activity
VGDNKADGFHAPPRPVSLESFWIDQYETTNAEYQVFLNQTGAPPPTVPLDVGQHPVRGVTFEQASAYCQWMNKRLPKEAEWEAAGRGEGENPRLFPWEDPDLTRQASNEIYEVGAEAFNVSPFEVHDLVGNVWEWVDEPYESIEPGLHVLRGGRFSLPQDLAYRYLIAPDHPNIQYAGFRCAADEVSS